MVHSVELAEQYVLLHNDIFGTGSFGEQKKKELNTLN